MLLRATDGAADKMARARAAATALADKLGRPGSAPSVVVCDPTPAQIQSQHDALTLLFTRN